MCACHVPPLPTHKMMKHVSEIRPINARVMSVMLAGNPGVTLIAGYAPTADETVEHIFLHCPHYKGARTALLSNTNATTIKELLSNASHAHHVQKFISNAILRHQDDDTEDL